MQIEAQNWRSNKLIEEMDMHYSMILGFDISYQSLVDDPQNSISSTKEEYMEEPIVEHALEGPMKEVLVQFSIGA